MSILSTSSKLVKVGGIEYSAGSGISIDDYVISVTGEFGKTYSAGDNIGIYEQDNQLYISAKDWTDDITAASANAYEQATAMIPPEFDPSFISGAVDSISGELDNKLNTSSFNTWLDGQYTSDISHIEGEINYISGVTTAAQQDLSYLSGEIDNRLETTAFTAWSAAQAENDYELSAGSGISLYNDDVNKLTRIDVTGTFGNPEVENYVQSNSGAIDEVNSAVETYSASWNEVSAISGTYMATYGSTTLNQIGNAVGSGLDVYCRYNDGHGRIMSAPLANMGYGAYTFTTTYNDNVYYFVIQPDGGDGAWSISSKSVLTAQTQSDWDVTDTASPAYIQNKPDLNDYAKVSSLNDYVPFSATELPIGDSNTATNTGFAQGNSNSADNASIAQGYYNSASTYSLAQGGRNYAYQDSFAQGIDNSAIQYSLAQGKANSAYNYGVAIGSANSAFNYSQAFGRATIATASGMAIGTYNKTQDAAFVIGDGESEYVKSDSFIVFRDGSVSAKGKISADGVELGAGGVSGDYVPYSGDMPHLYLGDNNTILSGAFDVKYNQFILGTGNKVRTNNTYIFGDDTTSTAGGSVFSIGSRNIVGQCSFTKGYNNNNGGNGVGGFIFGDRNTAWNEGFVFGDSNRAENYATTIGGYCSAYWGGICIGMGCVFSGNLVGSHNYDNEYGLALGRYNSISSDAALVIGNGSSNSSRSDSFVIYHDGSVSACGKISANGVELGGGYTPTYDYTNSGLISAIDTSGLYATSALEASSAKSVKNGGTFGTNISQYAGRTTAFYYMPTTSPFGTPRGIFAPLQFATGACLAMSCGEYAAYFKGNEWYVSNTAIGQALRGETHNSRGVHISGATTVGNSFDLSVYCVSGNNNSHYNYNWKLERGCVSGKDSNGEWRYGYAEDTKLRNLSAQYEELKTSYDALSSLFATYSGQWLLPNEGV